MTPATGSPLPLPTRRLRLVAAGCAALSAALVVLGSFLPQFSAKLSMFGRSMGSTITGWGVEVLDPDQRVTAVPISGYALSAAAALLLGATLACVLAAMPAAAPGAPRVAGLIAMGAAAFLAGAVSLVATNVLAYEASFDPGNFGSLGEEISIDSGVGVGLWLLVAAVVLALLTAVAMLRSTSARHQDAVVPETDLPTPPLGIPVLAPIDYEPQQPDAPSP